ncbi:MAG: hypothetical protein Q7U57_01055 [Methylovulum sp.]|nr:hypothetical protein [Methylovulum sp.]
MDTQDEYIKKLEAELIDHCARIDLLVIELKNTAADKKPAYDQKLLELRAKQQEITKILQKLEKPSPGLWENIGNGG